MEFRGPSVLAVLRLMTSSYLVGCPIGPSASRCCAYRGKAVESYPCVPIRFIQSALWADCPIFDIRLDDPKDCYAWPRGADKRARSCQVVPRTDSAPMSGAWIGLALS